MPTTPTPPDDHTGRRSVRRGIAAAKPGCRHLVNLNLVRRVPLAYPEYLISPMREELSRLLNLAK